MEELILYIAGIGFASLICQWVAWRIKLPSILLLLLVGILLGPATKLIDPRAMFGHLFIPIINISAAIILFEGSLTLNFKQITGMGTFIRRLLLIGVIVTFVLTSLICHFLLGLNIEMSTIIGAMLTVTGPTVITPLLRSVRPHKRIANILKWEGILVDPIGVILAIITFSFIAAYHTESSFWPVLTEFVEMTTVAILLGVSVGYTLGKMITSHRLPDFLYNVAILVMVIVSYAVANLVDEGSGLLTVTILGVCLGNMKNMPIEDILGFKESLSILLISGLFILLAADMKFAGSYHAIKIGGILFLFLQFLVRPIAVLFSSYKSNLDWKELSLISWIAPRGIIAATIAAIFTLRLSSIGVKGTDDLVIITFTIITLTVIFQSLTAGALASYLELRNPVAQGALIIGANPFAIEIAKLFQKNNIECKLASSNWQDISIARQAGLNTYYGNPTSEHADRHLDLVGVGKLIALSGNHEINTLACMRYVREFGRKNIYSVATTGDDSQALVSEKHQTALRYQGKRLFSDKNNIESLNEKLLSGLQIRQIKIGPSTSLNEYKDNNPEQVPLCVIKANQTIEMIYTSSNTALKTGDILVVIG